MLQIHLLFWLTLFVLLHFHPQQVCCVAAADEKDTTTPPVTQDDGDTNGRSKNKNGADDASSKKGSNIAWFDTSIFTDTIGFFQEQRGDNSNPFADFRKDGNPASFSTRPNQTDFFKQIWELLKPEQQRKAKDGDNETEESRRILIRNLIENTFSAADQKRSFKEFIDIFLEAAKSVQEQVARAFGNIGLERFDPLQLYYFMQKEEENKNSVWKRRRHRYMPALSEDLAVQLGDALYLSQLSYADSCDQVQQYVKTFRNGTWGLLRCTTSGTPFQPAHFVMARRATVIAEEDASEVPIDNRPWWKRLPLGGRRKPKGGSIPADFRHPDGDEMRHVYDKDEVASLEVAIVVRGTKDLADVLSDCLLDAVDLCGGKAHEGILRSARWLVDVNLPVLQDLLHVAPAHKRKIRLWLLGHSLGGGTAALAAMEFKDRAGKHQQRACSQDWKGDLDETTCSAPFDVDAYSFGFGSPAVLSTELSQSLRNQVVTVVTDADLVPRMSGALVTNAWLRVLDYSPHNWTSKAVEDIDQLVTAMRENIPFGDSLLNDELVDNLKKFLIEQFQKAGKEKMKLNKASRVQQQLIPPGDCIHIYRDGTSWRGTFTQCSFFDEMEFVRHMIDDHLIPTGYYQSLLGYVRTLRQDANWRFRHDLSELPVT